MKELVLAIAICSLLTTAWSLKITSNKKVKGRTDESSSKNIADFYQKLSNIPSSNSLNGKIENIQTALVILHGYLDTVKVSTGKGQGSTGSTNTVDDAKVDKVLNGMYGKLKDLYTVVENAGNSRVYKSLNVLYDLLSWMYGEEFQALVREELPIEDTDMQKEPSQGDDNDQTKDENTNQIIAQLSDMDSMLKDINSNAKFILDENRRNVNFVNAMSRALHKTYSDDSKRQSDLARKSQAKPLPDVKITSQEGQGQTAEDATTEITDDSESGESRNVVNEEMVDLLLREILQKKYWGNK